MFQVPLWTSTKACVHPVWSSRAPLLLSSAASRLPASVLCVGVPVFVFCAAPSVLPSFPDPAIPDPRCFYCLLASPCLSVAPFVFWFRVLVIRSSALLWIWLFTFWVSPNFVGPWRFSLHPPLFVPALFLVLCLSCSGLSVRASCLVCCVRFDGDVGPASSHGLDRTAANFTGAAQWSSLPCCPERPRAAKSAHMVPSVESSGILHLCALPQLFTDNLGRAALLQTVLGRWNPDSFEQLCLAPGDEPCDYWGCNFARAMLWYFHRSMASLTYNLCFMVVTAMAIHLDASRLLLRRDHTVLHEVHDFHQFRSLIQPAPWLGPRLWLGWLVYPIPIWGLGSTATGLLLRWYMYLQSTTRVHEYSEQGSRIPSTYVTWSRCVVLNWWQCSMTYKYFSWAQRCWCDTWQMTMEQ